MTTTVRPAGRPDRPPVRRPADGRVAALRGPRPVFERPAHAATAVGLGVLATVLVVQAAVPGGWGGFAWLPLVVGLLAGLPHGAVDHLVPRFRRGADAPPLALVVVGYAAVAVLAYLAFRALPGPALVVFVVLTVLHFGAGDTTFTSLRSGRSLRTDPVGVLAWGGVALLVPLLLHPADSAAAIAALVPGADGRLPGWVAAVVLPLVLLAVAANAARALRCREPLEAVELLLLLAVGVVCPLVVAFGAYFGGVHAVRHTARLLAEDPANSRDLRLGRLGGPLFRFARQAALPTAAALAVLALLWSAAGGWRGFLTADLALLAGLTVPHVVVVSWMDAQQRRAARP